jgi:hypothetical protein
MSVRRTIGTSANASTATTTLYEVITQETPTMLASKAP